MEEAEHNLITAEQARVLMQEFLAQRERTMHSLWSEDLDGILQNVEEWAKAGKNNAPIPDDMCVFLENGPNFNDKGIWITKRLHELGYATHVCVVDYNLGLHSLAVSW